MSKHVGWIGFGMLAVALSACTALPGLQSTAGSASLQVLPQVLAGGYHAQALLAPWTPQDVSHVEISVLTLSGGEESPALLSGKLLSLDVPKTSLGSSVTVAGLMPNTRYRLRARAFKSAGTQAADVISTEAAFVDVMVLTDDRPMVATLSIPLQDIVFDGRATSSFEILPGRLAPIGSESLQLGERAE